MSQPSSPESLPAIIPTTHQADGGCSLTGLIFLSVFGVFSGLAAKCQSKVVTRGVAW